MRLPCCYKAKLYFFYFFEKKYLHFEKILLYLQQHFVFIITVNHIMHKILEILVAYLFVPNEPSMSVAHSALLLFGVRAMFIYLLPSISKTVEYRYIYRLYMFIHFIPDRECCPSDVAVTFRRA